MIDMKELIRKIYGRKIKHRNSIEHNGKKICDKTIKILKNHFYERVPFSRSHTVSISSSLLANEY